MTPRAALAARWARLRARLRTLCRAMRRGEVGGGSVSVPVAAAMISIFTVAGLAVDGARQAQNIARADALAEEAARAGGQAVSQSALIGGTVQVDPTAAVAAAQNYLSTAGVSGTATVVAPDRIRVTATTTESTVLLGLVGLGTVTATGSGEALLVPTLAGEPIGAPPPGAGP